MLYFSWLWSLTFIKHPSIFGVVFSTVFLYETIVSSNKHYLYKWINFIYLYSTIHLKSTRLFFVFHQACLIIASSSLVPVLEPWKWVIGIRTKMGGWFCRWTVHTHCWAGLFQAPLAWGKYRLQMAPFTTLVSIHHSVCAIWLIGLWPTYTWHKCLLRLMGLPAFLITTKMWTYHPLKYHSSHSGQALLIRFPLEMEYTISSDCDLPDFSGILLIITQVRLHKFYLTHFP